jgi:hypothetical protein
VRLGPCAIGEENEAIPALMVALDDPVGCVRLARPDRRRSGRELPPRPSQGDGAELNLDRGPTACDIAVRKIRSSGFSCVRTTTLPNKGMKLKPERIGLRS